MNKEKVAKLIQEGLMTDSGLEMIELAKKTGTWDNLNDVENLKIPEDLLKKFQKEKIAFENFEKFSKSSKRGVLEWILNAKKSETRNKRIIETVSLAKQNIKANHPK